MSGTGAGPNEQNINYSFSWLQVVQPAQSANQYYDFFIFEFPAYAFNKQPLTVNCNVGYCRLMRGWNWVVWKYDVNRAVSAVVSMIV